jgi:hypothetical protein
MSNLEVLSAADCLQQENLCNYWKSPLPHPIDKQIGELLRAWMALSEDDRRESASRISQFQSDVLKGYGERMASLAVRERNEEFIHLGLVAIGVDDWRFDYRDNLVIVPLHYDAAKRIGADPDAIFERAALCLYGNSASGLRSFLRRTPHDKTIGVMGYAVDSNEQGFRYRRTW